MDTPHPMTVRSYRVRDRDRLRWWLAQLVTAAGSVTNLANRAGLTPTVIHRVAEQRVCYRRTAHALTEQWGLLRHRLPARVLHWEPGDVFDPDPMGAA